MVSPPSKFIYPCNTSLCEYSPSPESISPPLIIHHDYSPLPFSSIKVALRFSPPHPPPSKSPPPSTIPTTEHTTPNPQLPSINLALRWNSAAEAKSTRKRPSKNGEVSSHLCVVKSKLVPVKSHRRVRKSTKKSIPPNPAIPSPHTSTPASQLKADADMARRLFTEFTHNFFHPSKKTV